MLTRRTRRQLACFAVLSVTTVTYSAVTYLDVGQLAGVGTYDVLVEMETGAGLYDGSVVTLSGSPVGEVTDIELVADGVRVTARLEDGTRVPQASTVAIRSVSAAGEQYLDFTAPHGEGPFYANGDVVPAASVSYPVETSELLRSVDDLVRDLPADSLETTLSELGYGLSNGERDLRRAVDELLMLQETFTDNTRPTLELIDDLQTVLATQEAGDPSLRTFGRRLAEFSTQLAADDEALRGTLREAPSLADEVRTVIDRLGPTLPVLLGNLISVGEVTTVYDAALRQTLTELPGVTNAFQQAVNTSPVKGAVSLFLRALALHPPACTQGFVQDRRSPVLQTPIQPPTSVYCQVPPSSDQAVRGARNYPCPDGSGRGPTAASCGLLFQAPEQTVRVQREALATQVRVARAQRRQPDGKLTGGAPRVPSSLLADLAAPLPQLPALGATLPPSLLSEAPEDAWRYLVLSQLGGPR